MNSFVKVICAVLVLCMLVVTVACGSDGENENKQASQKVYNTAFKQATTAVPNSTQIVTSGQTTAEQTLPTTVKRSGGRKYFNQDLPMRKITSAQLLSEMGTGVTLADSFTARGIGTDKSVEDYETHLGNPVVSTDLIDAYSMAGFTSVRIPVSWTDHIDENGRIDSEWLERVNEVVDYVIEKDMYCIINSQNDHSWLTTNNKQFSSTKEKFGNMWKQIAQYFKNYNDRLIFEGAGELLKAENDKSAPSEIDLKNANELNSVFVNSVRATGGNNKKRHLVVCTYGSFVDSASLNGFAVPSDSAKNKLIAKVNIYAPSSFCLDEETINAWGTKDDKAYIDNMLSVINARFTELKIPVIIGEFGAVDKGNDSARLAYAQYIVGNAYNYYMVCFWNDNGSNMALFNRKDGSVRYRKIVRGIIDLTY